MKRTLIFAAAVALLASRVASATDFITTRSPDILVIRAIGLRGHAATITTKDGRLLNFGYGINLKTWTVDAVIMSVGGFLGLGSKCVAVVPARTQVVEQEARVDLTLDDLKQAPSFNSNDC